jgi:hypothetical protein
MAPPAVVLAAAASAALCGWAVVASTPAYPGSIGLNLNALGTDWMVFYGAVRWFFDGNLGALFDGERFTTYLNLTFSGGLAQPISFRPWVYPPSYLLVLLPFGTLSFAASYLAFQLISASFLAASLWFGAERPDSRPIVIGAVLIGPAAAINVGMGQNAFLSAALLVGGFRVSRARPALGGAILGLLTVKPQFWLLVPVALAAGREWRALGSSVLAAAALALASALVFGIDSWRHWLDLVLGSYADPQGKWVELGRMWGDSIYACLVSGGASHTLANAAQAAGSLIGIGLVYGAFRLPLAGDQKIAVLLAGTILAAPHSSLADTVLLASAVALWISKALEGPAPLAAWTLALAVWLVPLVNPPLVSPPGRLTPLLVLAFIGMILAGADRAAGVGTKAVTTAVPAAPGHLAAEE